MKKFAIAVLLLFSALSYAQTDNTLYAKQFPGADVGTKVANAQKACSKNTAIPCLIVIDPSLAVWPTGTMPLLAANVNLMDYRAGVMNISEALVSLTAVKAPNVSGATVYTSNLSGATPVAAIAPGSSSTGYADSAPAINAALASSGLSKLVVDGKYALGSTLSWPSNVEIGCTPGSGFIMLPNSNVPMLMNSGQVKSPSSCSANVSGVNGGYLVSNQCNQHMIMDGCTMNFNSTQSITASDHKTANGMWVPATQFLGVDDIQFKDTLIYDSGSYNYFFDNVSHVILDNARFCDPPISGTPCALGTMATSTDKNTDGYHFNGPANQIDISRAIIGPNTDDGIALNADDCYESPATCTQSAVVAYPGWTVGPISDVQIHDMKFNNIREGIRLLSAGQPIDRISIDGLHGKTTSSLLTLNNFNIGSYPCSLGNLEVTNVDADSDTNNGLYYSGADWDFNCPTINSMNFQNVSRPPLSLSTESGSGVVPVFQTSTTTTVGTLNLKGITINNSTGVQSTLPLIILYGTTKQMLMSSVAWSAASGSTYYLMGGYYPAAMTISGVSGPATLMNFAGTAPAISGDAASPTQPLTITLPGTGNTVGGINLIQPSLASGNTTGFYTGTAFGYGLGAFFGYIPGSPNCANVTLYGLTGLKECSDNRTYLPGDLAGPTGTVWVPNATTTGYTGTGKIVFDSGATLNPNTLVVSSARRGTFTCTAGGNILISNTNFVTGSDVIVTMETSGATPAQPYMNTPVSGTSFKEQCGGSDTSTYRYSILN